MDDVEEAPKATQPAALVTLFGVFQLRTADGREIAINNRRARSLLAMLCVQTGQSIDRDYLSKLLWPGRFEAHAKASLRQCLLELGKLLAPLDDHALIATRNTISLNRGAIGSDLDALSDALARSDHVSACEQLGFIGAKPILDQLDLGAAFDQWLARCRSEVEARLYAGVTATLGALERSGETAAHARLLAAWSACEHGGKPVTAFAGVGQKNRIAVLPFQMVGDARGKTISPTGLSMNWSRRSVRFRNCWWRGVPRQHLWHRFEVVS